MTTAPAIRRPGRLDDALVSALAELLVDSVEGDASVGFLHPLSRERALAFFDAVAADVAAGRRAVLVAEDADGVCGTVQLVLGLPENQPHRAELVKLLVHRRARRRGVATALMHAVERTALDCGRWLLVLDAVTGGTAARLYESLGWVRAGDIPDYALAPRGGLVGTTYYYRDLRG